MTRKSFMSCWIVLAGISTVPLVAQERQAARVIKVPHERGVYLETPSGMVALQTTLFMPFLKGGIVKQMLGVGSRGLTLEMAGANAAVNINRARPTFYLRGYRPGSRMYLVRGVQKQDHRELRMTLSGHFTEWARFRSGDLAEVEVEALADDLAMVRPRADLQPGEYAFVSVLEPRYRWMRLAYEFGVSRASGGP